MSVVDEVRNRALELPHSDRAALARDLLLSLESGVLNEDVQTEWAQEIEARSDAVARGDFVAREWRESLARIRQKLAERRS